MLQEIALNRLVHPLVPFDMGFRVLEVAADADLVHVHSHPTVLRGLGTRPVVFSAGSSHYHYVRYYEGWSEERIEAAYVRARKLYRRLGMLDALLNHERITLAYTFSSWAREKYLQEGVPEWKIRVVPPGFDISRAASSEPRGRRSRSCFSAASRGERGDTPSLKRLRACALHVREARLLYVSDESPRRQAKEWSQAAGFPAEVGELYGAADVFVNPTLAEGFGFTNVEAQGHGLPVVSSRIAAIPEVVDDGRTGILIDPEASELLEGMERFAADGTRCAARWLTQPAAGSRALFPLCLPLRAAGSLQEPGTGPSGRAND